MGVKSRGTLNRVTLVIFQLDAQKFFIYLYIILFIKILYMFRAVRCSKHVEDFALQ
jgi:hypothetical protein